MNLASYSLSITVKVKAMLASKCENPGKQISGSSYDRTDDIEPILYSSPVHKDSPKCISQKDWISSRVCPDESIESIWCPYAGSRMKIPSHSLWLGISLLYLRWAGAGNQAIILAKRCSVMPLKCVCCVLLKHQSRSISTFEFIDVEHSVTILDSSPLVRKRVHPSDYGLCQISIYQPFEELMVVDWAEQCPYPSSVASTKCGNSKWVYCPRRHSTMCSLSES
jgi:hypothetical protein